MLKNFLITSLLFSLSFGQYDYSLEDINTSSDYFEQNVGTSYFPDQVTLHYFGHYNWGTCTARFEQLNDLYEDLLSQGYSDVVKLIGVGKSQHMSSLDNWVDGNDASVCADTPSYPIWSEWDASQRDLYILDHEGSVAFHENVTGGLPFNLESLVINLINQIPGDSECEDGEVNNENPCNPMECFGGEWIEIIIDCEEQMGVPCEGGVYIPPAEGECCSTCILLGDISGDGIINVLDVVAMVNLVLSGNYDAVADLNSDGTLNVLDVVLLVGIILG